MTAPRVGIVGGARRRQGLGPFVVRDLVKLGATVPAFVSTRPVTRDAIRADFAADPGIDTRGYLDTSEMLAHEELDAMAILSPSESHGDHLAAALGAGLPVLCEKPLIWGGPDLAARARAVVADFAATRIPLWENCQWPYTLEAYECLHPGALEAPPTRFDMWLQPAATGSQALGDSLPHALSLLQALVPACKSVLEDIVFTPLDAAAGAYEVAFDYRADAGCVRARVSLTPSESSPRAAAFALDGRRAERRVSGPDYRLSFVGDAGREVPLEDPMTQLLADFVAMLRGEAPRTQRTRIAERMALLAQLVEAHDDAEAAGLRR